MNKIDIRRITAGDARNFRTVLSTLLPDDWRDGPIPDEPSIQNSLEDERTIVFAAFFGVEPVGYVSGFVMRSLAREGDTVMLDDLLTAPDFRNQGVGENLVNAFCEAARSTARPPVLIWSGTGVDNDACQRVFIKTGGVRIDEIFQEFNWRQT